MNLAAIPEALKARTQWVLWKIEVREGKPTKVPYNPKSRGKARSNTSSTWGTYAQAVEAWQRHPSQWDGVGFMFASDDPYTGVDLDQCIAEDGTLKEWAKPIVALLDTYAERSPSGRGLHLFVEGTLPEESRHKVPVGDGHVEAYDRVRFFTMTGDVWDAREIAGRQTEIEDVVRLWLGTRQEEEQQPRAASVPVDLDDRALLDVLFNSATKGSRVRALWSGDTSIFGGDDSAADQSLANDLAFVTGRDAARMDQMFRQSGLFRPKWDEVHYANGRTYGAETIRKAVSGTREDYTPPRPRESAPPPSDEDVPTDWVGLHEGERLANGAQRKLANGSSPNGTHPAPVLTLPELYSAAELQKTELPPLSWALEGFLPEGVILLVAHSKIGKTFLAEDVAVAIALGGRAWGKVPVEQGKVIYVDTEGSKRRVQKRIRALLGSEVIWPDDLLLTHDCITLDANGFAVIRALLAEHPTVRLLVLDTLNAMRPGRANNLNLVKEEYELIRGLRALGEEHRCAILLLHHRSLTAKSDSVNAGAGTHGLAAAASVVLTFERTRGEHDAIMEVAGNDIESEGRHHFRRDPRSGFWTLEGDADEFMKSKERQAVFDLLIERGPMSPSAVAVALKKPADGVRKMMRRMAFGGELTSDDGVYSIPQVRN